jgi:hypothetical protein
VLPHNAVIVRRAAVLDVGGYDERLRVAEDYDLWFRLAWRHPFACTHAVTAMWRRHAGHTSGKPIPYWTSEYAARARFVASVADGTTPPRSWGQPLSPLDVQAAAVRIWEDHLAAAWYGRAAEFLRFHLAMGRTVRGSARASWRWRLKRHLLWLAVARERRRTVAAP